MAKLTDRQRKQIIAEYVGGNGMVSKTQLAKKYGVTRTTIIKILGAEANQRLVTEAKKVAEISMLSFMQGKEAAAQELIDKIMEKLGIKIDEDDVRFRDLVGALKVLSDIFVPENKDESETKEPKTVEIRFVGTDTGGLNG